MFKKNEQTQRINDKMGTALNEINMSNTSSPWARPHVEDEATSQPQEMDRAYLQLKTGEALIDFISQQRSKILADFFENDFPKYSNQILALGALSEITDTFQDLILATSDLIDGGITPEELVARALHLEDGEHEMFSDTVEEIRHLDQIKLLAETEEDFKQALLFQFHTILNAFQTYALAFDMATDMSAEIHECLSLGVDEFIEHGRFPAPPATPEYNVMAWPMVAPLMQFAENMGQLCNQAKIASLAAYFQASTLNDTQDQKPLTDLLDAIDMITSTLAQETAEEIAKEVYMFDLVDAAEGLLKIYKSEEAENPNTTWQIDPNMMITVKARAMTGRLMQTIAETPELKEDRALLSLLPYAAKLVFEGIEAHYPVQDALKPAFIQAREDAVEQSLKDEMGQAPSQTAPHGAKPQKFTP